MTLTEKNNILFQLGGIFKSLGENLPWKGYELGINENEYNALDELCKTVHIYNGWFKEAEVRKAFLGISKWLTADQLKQWVDQYDFPVQRKNVAIIMAGNIPLVGFHDFLSVFMSGHKAIIKLSSDDQHLFPAVLKTMSLFNDQMSEYVQIVTDKMEGFDAVIATGSDNSATYFESYFGKYPNIIRKNRTSVAFLEGDESKDELQLLGHDIFDFYGLGCRNVSQIWIPESFEMDRFFEAIFDFQEIIYHNKYANNYDYNKAVYLMNQLPLLDNGFLLLKEDKALNSPLGVLHYVRYKSREEFDVFKKEQNQRIQVVVGRDYTPFGCAQQPELTDYADRVDTLEFLTNLM